MKTDRSSASRRRVRRPCRNQQSKAECRTALVVPSHACIALFGRLFPAPGACEVFPRLWNLVGPATLSDGFGDMRGYWMFEEFIFDVEGTLIDSVLQNQRSLQDALEKSGYRIPIQTLRIYSGLDGDQTLQLAVPDASERE
jgi:hypothetical protein